LEKTLAEADGLTLVENLQREDLTPTEEAEALGILMHVRGWSVRGVALVRRGCGLSVDHSAHPRVG
jgi:ParB-like chromosome segregation protein Spo0J